MEHAHQSPCLFVPFPDFFPKLFALRSHFGPQFHAHGRKLTANLLAELHELRLEAGDPFRQGVEGFHAALQAIYTNGKRLRHDQDLPG